MKVLWVLKSSKKRENLFAVFMTIINLIVLKIYENEILEDSLVNNFPHYFRYKAQRTVGVLGIAYRMLYPRMILNNMLKIINPCKEHIGCIWMRSSECRQYQHRAPPQVASNYNFRSVGYSRATLNCHTGAFFRSKSYLEISFKIISSGNQHVEEEER